jgi:hypothetical protein
MKILHNFIITIQRKFQSANRRGSLGGGFLLLFLLASLAGQAQIIGDLTRPLKYSTHTYRVNMGNPSNTVTWNIYDSTATRERVDVIDIAYSKTVAYRVISQTQAAGVASFTIEFSGSDPTKMPAGKRYRIAYKEQEVGSTQCFIIEFFDFILQSPFDVDILPVAAEMCPDADSDYREGIGTPTSQTVVDYEVVLRNSDYNPGGNWYFRFTITVAGQGGTDGTIAIIDYPGNTIVLGPAPSTYTGDAAISTATKSVPFTITYNDVPGVRERIDFNLTLIEGAYAEKDIDYLNGTLGQNEVTHYINGIPGASFILAMD